MNTKCAGTTWDADKLVTGVSFQEWSFQLDDFELALLPISDITVLDSSQLACMSVAVEEDTPYYKNERNGIVKADLRQTPEDLLGKPFQNYLFVTAKVDQPTAITTLRQVRLFRLLADLLPVPDEDAKSPWGLVRALDLARLKELVECLRLCVGGFAGQLFVAENADMLEDLVGKLWARCIKPLLQVILGGRGVVTDLEVVV